MQLIRSTSIEQTVAEVPGTGSESSLLGATCAEQQARQLQEHLPREPFANFRPLTAHLSRTTSTRLPRLIFCNKRSLYQPTVPGSNILWTL